MGNGLGKDEKKKVQVNKSNSYPQPSKRGRRSTVDGALSHLNLEPGAKKEKGSKFGTGTFTKDIKLQQQLATLQLGETIGKRPGRKAVRPPQTENGRDGSEGPETPRKRGSTLNFIQNSLKRNKQVTTPAPAIQANAYDTGYESIDNAKTFGANNTPSSLLSPSLESGYFANDDFSHSKPISSISEESDYMSSSVSSVEVGRESFRRENSYGTSSFVDPDNVVGYSDIMQKNTYRPRGRSVSDSLFSSDSRESSLSEIQKAIENEKKKK